MVARRSCATAGSWTRASSASTDTQNSQIRFTLTGLSKLISSSSVGGRAARSIAEPGAVQRGSPGRERCTLSPRESTRRPVGMSDHFDIGYFLQATVALIAIANPVAALPTFLSLVPDEDPAAKRQAANRVAVAVFVILAGAVLLGSFVLEIFGISFAAFRAGGGLVVTLTGLDMLRRRHTGHDPAAASSAADELILPMAMPLIAGPGTIITAMTMAARASSTTPGLPWIVLAAVAVVAAVVWLVLAASGFVRRRIGMRGQTILVRFMGLVLVAIGAQLVLGGIAEFFGMTRVSPVGGV